MTACIGARRYASGFEPNEDVTFTGSLTGIADIEIVDSDATAGNHLGWPPGGRKLDWERAAPWEVPPLSVLRASRFMGRWWASRSQLAGEVSGATMSLVELRGAQVHLRPTEADDVDSLVAMYREPAVSRWWPRYDRNKVAEEFLHPDDDTVVYTIVVGGEVAGLIQSWVEDDPDYRHAGIDIAVSTRWHGSGVAVDALRTLVRHLVDTEGHHRIVIDPALANTRAIACYEKVGFRRVGVMRKYERGADGTFHDSVLMELLADESGARVLGDRGCSSD